MNIVYSFAALKFFNQLNRSGVVSNICQALAQILNALRTEYENNRTVFQNGHRYL